MKHLDEVTWKLIYEDLFDRECPPQVTKTGKGLKSSLFHLWQYTLSEGISIEGKSSLSRFYLMYEDINLLKEKFKNVDFYGNNIQVSSNHEILSVLRAFVFGNKNQVNKGEFTFEGEEIIHHLVEIHIKLLNHHSKDKEIASISSISSEVLKLFKGINSKFEFLKIARIIHGSSLNQDLLS